MASQLAREAGAYVIGTGRGGWPISEKQYTVRTLPIWGCPTSRGFRDVGFEKLYQPKPS
jgi:hypothetical protein